MGGNLRQKLKKWSISELSFAFVLKRVRLSRRTKPDSCENVFPQQLHYHPNQTHFHIYERFIARRLVLKQRHNQKWSHLTIHT